MKHLLTGVAVIAVLAISAPVWAQPANPSGGNSLGVPGPNPGGPGLTPYSTGAPPPPIGPDARRREADIRTDQYPVHALGLRRNRGDAPDAPSRAQRFAWQDGGPPAIDWEHRRSA
jgi:hypothetical protein